MYDFMLTPKEQAVKREARDFVNAQITSDFLRKMDKDEIVYPREFVEQVAQKNCGPFAFLKNMAAAT